MTSEELNNLRIHTFSD